MELALALDRRTWYNLYEQNTIEKFTELYWKENGIGGWEQHKIIPDRLYIGNAFCHLLLPGEEQLFALMEKANVENVGITLVFPCMREFQVEEMGKLLKKWKTGVKNGRSGWKSLSMTGEWQRWSEKTGNIWTPVSVYF